MVMHAGCKMEKLTTPYWEKHSPNAQRASRWLPNTALCVPRYQVVAGIGNVRDRRMGVIARRDNINVTDAK